MTENKNFATAEVISFSERVKSASVSSLSGARVRSASAEQKALVNFESESVRIELISYVLKCESQANQLHALGFVVETLDDRTPALLAEIALFNNMFPEPESRLTTVHRIQTELAESFVELERRALALSTDYQFAARYAVAWQAAFEKMTELDLMSSPKSLFATRSKINSPVSRSVIEFAANPTNGICRFEALLSEAHAAIQEMRLGDVERCMTDLHVVNHLHDAARYDFCEYLEVIDGGLAKTDLPATDAE